MATGSPSERGTAVADGQGLGLHPPREDKEVRGFGDVRLIAVIRGTAARGNRKKKVSAQEKGGQASAAASRGEEKGRHPQL